MYYNNIVPFLGKSFMVKDTIESVNVVDIYCPLVGDLVLEDSYVPKGIPKIIHILPINVKVFDMDDKSSWYYKNGKAGEAINARVTYLDYSMVARGISYDDDSKIASIFINGGYIEEEDILTGAFIANASAGIDLGKVSMESIGVNVQIPLSNKVNILSSVETVAEASFADAKAAFTRSDGSVDVGKGSMELGTDDIEKWLSSYLDSPPSLDEQVPLLLGYSAVFKSATVKDLCKKKGMRMVDFRAAFTTRLDYTGMVEKAPTPDGNVYSYQCPMEPLYTCSDGFIEFCRRSVEELNKILSQGYIEEVTSSNGNKVVNQIPLDADKTDELNSLITKYSFYVDHKPVLFFDEITRCKEKGVQNVLTTILNQKILGKMTLKGCKFVAASNSGLGDDMLDDLYQTQNDVDAAYAARFIKIKVLPTDVLDRWMKWAESSEELKDVFGNLILDANDKTIVQQHIHPVVLSYLKENPDDVYNMTEVRDMLPVSTDDAALIPYPNYRSWDMISQYLYKRDGSKILVDETIRGLIGNSGANRFIKYLKKKGYSVQGIASISKSSGIDEMSVFLEENLDANVPTMLIGPSALGKTSRINAFKKRGWEVLPINLATMERSDLMGAPTKYSATDYVSRGLQQNKDYRSIVKTLDGVMKGVLDNPDYGLPPKMTLNAPTLDVAQMFKRCMEQHPPQPVILFFDECNRVTNDALMSSMFSAISDHNIFGVNFDPRYVKVVAACNMGENYTSAKPLDSALSARFSMYRKPGYDEGDVKSYIEFLTNDDAGTGKHKILIGYLQNIIDTQGYGALVSLFSQVEQTELETGVPSTRALKQLSEHLQTLSKSADFNGTAIFSSPNMENVVSDINYMDLDSTSLNNIQSNFNYFKNLVPNILREVSGWAPNKAGTSIKVDGKSINASQLVDYLTAANTEFLQSPSALINISSAGGVKEINDNLKTISSLVLNMQEMDSQMCKSRENMFGFYLGEVAARDFAKYFNLHFGRDLQTITIEMLDVLTNIHPFFMQKLGASGLTQDQLVDEILKNLNDIYAYWDVRLPAENYVEIFVDGLNYITSSKDLTLLCMSKFNSNQDNMLAVAEQTGNDFIKSLVNTFTPYTIDDATIDSIRGAMSGSAGTGPSVRPRLL